MIVEGYLHHWITKWQLSRITEPIFLKLCPFPWKDIKEGRSIDSSFHSFPLLIVNVFLPLTDASLITLRLPRSFPLRAPESSWMDWTRGKSESSIHPFNYSQMQLIRHNGMRLHQVWHIAIGEDLWIQSNQPIKPVIENDETHWKL